MNNRAFYNAAGVRAEDLPFSPRSEKLFERLRPIFDNLIFRGCRTLEIGCGNGRISFAIEKSGACPCGIDFADEPVFFAKRFAKNTGSCAEFFTADAVNFSLRKRFDLIFLVQKNIVEFFPTDFSSMLQCVYAHLTKKGSFLTELYENDGHGPQKDRLAVPGKGEFDYYTYVWTPARLDAALKKQFKSVRSYSDDIVLSSGRLKKRYVFLAAK